ncbi:methyltransferase [Methanosarcina sp. A14]|uniref:Methyltransferase domain protein n=6 Tax=Methanosarcina TaxID=2207 RepID=A0A0E3QX87_METBA|nr:class I SAM-dependent methyltransferase [Methanosarcina barkeri]AKB55419.1 Methyltransferase domain protein [Methanosarcina barkeri MS]AKB58902.1 Methyltransferase domain protein [Methanosarcina barkeri 227]AKJ38564.1 methyltransferase [Methanosarcina barkeri CM1]OED08993.1 methyltransferase [Methanosarcina sp. A14]
MESLNKICAMADWDDPELLEMMKDVLNLDIGKYPELLETRHRKHWEWAIGMLAMKKAGKMDNNCNFLGIGSGSEAPVFYLTNHAKYVFSTDLYTITSRRWKEANTDMLTNPERFAPSQFNRKRLGVQIMSGTNIHFDDNTFDAVFSYSSIEHFGGKDAAAKSMKEIERVLKPGGVASIATEIFVCPESRELYRERKIHCQFPLRLFRRYSIFSEMFTHEELEQYLLASTNMKPLWPIDYSVEKSDLERAVNYPNSKTDKVHIFLNLKGILWGSIHIALVK